MLVILLIGVECAFVPLNDVALDRVDIDPVRVEIIEDAVLLKDLKDDELLEICDEEAFVEEENLEDNEVVVASPSAATALTIHIVVQIIVVLGWKSLMVFLGTHSLTHSTSCAGSSSSCRISKETANVGF